MSIFRKGSKQEREELERETRRSKEECEQEADSIMRKTLETVESDLRVKREVREKAARFVSALRPGLGYTKPT